ncbi:MAG: hypothetical protein ACRBB5_06525 [Nitrosopumilus sp.]
MDMKKFIEEQNLFRFPIGLVDCKICNSHYDSCGYDVVVFDEKLKQDQIISYGDNYVVIHHASLSEIQSKKLLQYDKLQIIHDESWDLQMLLSQINEKRSSLFVDFAKNCLIESMFCCEKTKESIQNHDQFGACWQKCASFYLSDAISSLNNQKSSSSHMLDLLRKLKPSLINEHISFVTETVGIERATHTLLQRMLKSTIGFSDLIEKNNHSKIIQKKYDFFIENSMLSDCYFYLGYVNKEIFVTIKNILNKNPELIHILKIAFDIESDSNLLLQQADLVHNSCNTLLEIISRE